MVMEHRTSPWVALCTSSLHWNEFIRINTFRVQKSSSPPLIFRLEFKFKLLVVNQNIPRSITCCYSSYFSLCIESIIVALIQKNWEKWRTKLNKSMVSITMTLSQQSQSCVLMSGKLFLFYSSFFDYFQYWGLHPWTWRWKMKAGASEVLHEQPLCVESKPSKLSPLAVVWTVVRWELVLGVCLFVVMVSKGSKPSHSIGLASQGSWRTGHTKALCDGVITVAAQTRGRANSVNDSLVWLPCSALLKSPCPETIHHIPSTCFWTLAGRTGYRNVKDHF